MSIAKLKEDKKIVIPNQFALGKAALPKRFAEWLQEKLLSELNVVTEIKQNNNIQYTGYGLEVRKILSGETMIEKKEEKSDDWNIVDDNSWEKDDSWRDEKNDCPIPF